MKCLCDSLLGTRDDTSQACIGQLWIFQSLPPSELRELTKAALRNRYMPGQAIFMQGEPADQMFLIKAGRVKLSKLAEDGTEITLDIRKPGDLLGESMLSEETSYPLNAWCMEETVVCGFTRERFESLVMEHPQVGLQVIKNLSGRISWLTSRAGSVSMPNLEDRLYQVLVNVAREHGTRSGESLVIQFPLTHEDLGFLVGVHRVSITRAMKRLRESGRIVQERRSLIVAGPKAR